MSGASVLRNERHAARELALVMLFAVDVAKLDAPERAFEMFRENEGDEEVLKALFGEGEVDTDTLLRRVKAVFGAAKGRQWAFVERMVRGAMSHATAIDELISKSSLNWKIARMGRVDRNILRLSAYELAFEGDVPALATLNEAIELAKRFGTEDSGKFVNGILDRIAKDLERV